MEAKQFYSRNLSPLVTKSFACKWSEDNRISVVTEKGVHVIELLPSPTQVNPIVNLSRSFVNCPEGIPGELYSEDVSSKIYDWEKEEVYSFLMHDAFTPNFEKANKFVNDVVDVFWSPKKMVHSHNCMLAIVTTSGAIELAVLVKRNWISVHQFTDQWAKVVEEESQVGRKDSNYQSLRNKLERLIVTTATWSPLCSGSDNSSFAYLITGHRNSEVAVWKINEMTGDIKTDQSSVNVELKFKKKIIDDNVKINTLHWVQLDEKNYLLLIGFFNGQVAALKLQEDQGKFTSTSCTICYEDVDNISVDYLNVLENKNNQLQVLVAKGMHLLILDLNNQGERLDMKFISSPTFSITGVSIIDPNKILISTQDGSLYTVENLKEELICKPLKIDISKSNIQYLGVASSCNKLLYIVIASPSTVYDHLIDREPSNIFFFYLSSDNSLENLDFQSKQPFYENWDYLDLLKVNALKSNNLLTNLKLSMDFESMPIDKLRYTFWMIVTSQSIKKKTKNPPEELELCKNYIFLRTASNHIIKLAQNKSLTELQKLCMSLLKNHLEIWLAGEEEEVDTPLSEYVKEALKETNKFDLNVQEKCNFCETFITEPWALSCSEGHKLPRCAITCLQVTTVKFRSCNVCQEIFHPCLDDEMKQVRCLYCDLPVFDRNQIIDPSLYTSKRNLSSKNISSPSIKDAKEDEMLDKT